MVTSWIWDDRAYLLHGAIHDQYLSAECQDVEPRFAEEFRMDAVIKFSRADHTARMMREQDHVYWATGVLDC